MSASFSIYQDKGQEVEEEPQSDPLPANNASGGSTSAPAKRYVLPKHKKPKFGCTKSGPSNKTRGDPLPPLPHPILHLQRVVKEANANTSLKNENKSLKQELSAQKKLFAEREASLCQAHKEELDAQKASFVKMEASLSKSHDEKMQAKMEDMKTLINPIPKYLQQQEVQVARSYHKAEQKQQATHTAIWQAKKAVEAKLHISAHNLDVERRK
eukprot:5052343-Ditylum_brightwellii.AAC.1